MEAVTKKNEEKINNINSFLIPDDQEMVKLLDSSYELTLLDLIEGFFFFFFFS